MCFRPSDAPTACFIHRCTVVLTDPLALRAPVSDEPLGDIATFTIQATVSPSTTRHPLFHTDSSDQKGFWLGLDLTFAPNQK